MDCALSVTGPYESTAMFTGPIQRNAFATRQKAKTDACGMIFRSPIPEIRYATNIRPAIKIPFQKAEKEPATIPERIVNDAPPSLEAVTISCTCFECDEVNTFVNSGIKKAAKV